MSWDELHERSLELTVWDHDRLTTNDFLGGVRLNLGTGMNFLYTVILAVSVLFSGFFVKTQLFKTKTLKFQTKTAVSQGQK